MSSAASVELHHLPHTTPDHSMRTPSPLLHELAATREAIATILSVRRPRRVKKQRPAPQARQQRPAPRKRQQRPVESRTNQYVVSRVSSFQGEIRTWIPGYGWAGGLEKAKRGIYAVLDEAGRQQPAIATFTVCGGIGYLMPVAPQTGKEN